MNELMSIGAQLKKISIAAAIEEQQRKKSASTEEEIVVRSGRAEKSAHVTEMILETLEERGAINMHEIAKHLGISVPAVKHRLRALKSAGRIVNTYYGANVPSTWAVTK